MCVLFTFMYVCHVPLVPAEAKRGRWIPWYWSTDGCEPPGGCCDPNSLSARAACAFNCYTISPALNAFSFLVLGIELECGTC